MTAFPRPKFPLKLLILIMALAALYVRSYQHADIVVARVADGRVQLVGSTPGQFSALITNVSFGPAMHWTWDYLSAEPYEVDSDWRRIFDPGQWAMTQSLFSAQPTAPSSPTLAQRLGFSAVRADAGSLMSKSDWAITLSVPQWLTAPLLLFLFTRVWRWWRYYIRRRRGLCPYCGYDIRGMTERCPECGAEVLGKTA